MRLNLSLLATICIFIVAKIHNEYNEHIQRNLSASKTRIDPKINPQTGKPWPHYTKKQHLVSIGEIENDEDLKNGNERVKEEDENKHVWNTYSCKFDQLKKAEWIMSDCKAHLEKGAVSRNPNIYDNVKVTPQIPPAYRFDFEKFGAAKAKDYCIVQDLTKTIDKRSKQTAVVFTKKAGGKLNELTPMKMLEEDEKTQTFKDVKLEEYLAGIDHDGRIYFRFRNDYYNRGEFWNTLEEGSAWKRNLTLGDKKIKAKEKRKQITG